MTHFVVKPDSPYRARLKTFTILKVAESQALPECPITTPAAAAAYLMPFFRREDQNREQAAALFLDGKSRPIAAKVMFSGTTAEAVVYPIEIVRAALLLNASAVIFAHSHPSGILEESPQDISLSHRIASSLKELNLTLLDNLIVNLDGRYRSIPRS